MPSFLAEHFFTYCRYQLYCTCRRIILVIYLLKSTKPFKFSCLIVLKFKIKLDIKDFNTFMDLGLELHKKKSPASLSF